jgi:transcriptional regulator with XRE-family HTH domain
MVLSQRDETAKVFGERIRALRRRSSWSQEQLAERARLHRTYVVGIELGTRNPSLKIMARLARALGVPLPSLFETADVEKG